MLPDSRLNGLQVLSYSLEIDYDLSGNFKVVTGQHHDSLSLSYIVRNVNKGNTYACRYRARNMYGWSDYSPISYLVVAVEPAVANKPIFVSATNTNITVNLNLNCDHRGSTIL